MNKSESIANIAQALSDFQGEVSNPKQTADNPFFKSSYSPLSEVINTIRPILAKHGLSVLQAPSGDGERIIVTTLLMHSSGEWIEGDPLILKADKVTAQGAGSAISYGRRYALSAVLGIASEEEDDGNHASDNSGQGKSEQQKKTQQQKPVAQGVDWVGFFGACKALGYATKGEVEAIAKTKDFSKWTKEQADTLYDQLKALKNKGDK